MNHSFGGDVTALYATLGLKAPAKQERCLIVPVDRVGFAWTVFQVLGGRPFHRRVVVDSRADADRQGEEQQRNHAYKRLAEESLWYLQLQEVLGRSPDLMILVPASLRRLRRGSPPTPSSFGQPMCKSLSRPRCLRNQRWIR